MSAGIETVIEGRYRLEQGPHTWLDIVLNDEKYIKKPEVWEAIRGGIGKLRRTRLGRNPGPRKVAGRQAVEDVPWAGSRSQKGWLGRSVDH